MSIIVFSPYLYLNMEQIKLKSKLKLNFLLDMSSYIGTCTLVSKSLDRQSTQVTTLANWDNVWLYILFNSEP